MKKILFALVAFSSFAFSSMIGLDAMGEENVLGGTASAAGRGFAGNAKTGDAEGLSVVNPARLAFDAKVVFNLNFSMELDGARNGGDHYSYSSMSIPSFNLSFPMGTFGAMGLSLWQHFSSSFDDEYENKETFSNAKLEYKGSVYELVPTYAIRLPFIRSVSLGASAHVVMGNTSRNLTLGANNENIDKGDSWATGDYLLSDYVEGTWEIKDRGKNASYFFSFTTGYTLLNTLDYNFRFSELDTLKSTRAKREIDVPAMLATGINYRLAKRHNVMMDLTWRAWDKDIENVAGGWNMPEVTETQTDFMVSLGYQFDGSPLFYESYWNRINYRAGAWYRNWYIKDVFEVGGSIGGGFPLGRKGTTIDVAFQGGKRFADSKSEWEEMFIGLRIGLTGIATWGQTR